MTATAKAKSPRVRRNPAKTQRVVFLGDIHVPHHDHKAVALAVDFIRWFEPSHIYLIGDIVDFYALSRFDRDPTRMLSLQDELDQCIAVLQSIRKAAPKAEIAYRDGNHEHRLLRMLWQKPELSPLKALQLAELLQFSAVGIKHFPYNSKLSHKGFLVEHGDIVRKGSAYTAAGMLDRRQVSGITGHTHRLGTHFRTDASGDKVWLENGCLCDRNPEYIIGEPNWQHGFTVGRWIEASQRFFVEQVPIVGHEILYHDTHWKG